jgi:hypothetical protein
VSNDQRVGQVKVDSRSIVNASHKEFAVVVGDYAIGTSRIRAIATSIVERRGSRPATPHARRAIEWHTPMPSASACGAPAARAER